MSDGEAKLAKQGAGTLFIISAPSGAGKTTLVKRLCEQVPNLLVSISYTTRPRRKEEEHGLAYYFIDETTFTKMIERDEFLEYATVFDYHYGTSRQWVEENLRANNDIILEIDWQGARDIREVIPDCVSIFILPPSYSTLEQRLRGRGGDDDATIQRRMYGALSELSHYAEFDYLVINNDLEPTVIELRSIIESMRQNKPYKASDHQKFVEQLMTEGSNLQ